MWPGPRAPISTTTAWVPGSIRARVRGRPTSLLYDAGLATVSRRVARTAASRSLVVVLPLDPVTATTVAAERSRTAVPRAARAARGSATSTRGPAKTVPSWARVAAAPARAAASANRLPSVRLPGRATNRSPAATWRESTWTPVTTASGSASASRPPVTSATSFERERDHRAAPMQRAQLLGGDHAVVEGDLAAAGELLALLVALAGDQDGVARPGHGQGGPDGGPPVDLDQEPARPGAAGDALGHLVDDRLRVLGAGVVGGDHGHVGQPPGDLAHQRPLGPVAVAAAAEDHDHPAAGDRPGRPEQVVEGVGGVGVVDQHGERLAGVDPLEAAGHPVQGLEPGHGGAQVDAGGVGRGQGAQGVGHVEEPGQPQPDGPRPGGRPDPEAGALQGGGDVAGPPVGVGGGAGGDGGHLGRPGEQAPVGVVDVDHPEGGELRREQPPLGPVVVVQVGVEVEVVLGQVGEHGRLEAGAVDPVQGQAVAGHLHRRRLHARVGHLGQQPLEVWGLGGGVDGRPAGVADPHLDGAQQPRDQAGGPEDRLQHEGGGGLAVGAGHPDQVEAARGMVEERRRQRGQHLPDPADQQLGGLQVEGPLHAQGGRAGVEGLAGQVVAVEPGPGDAAEQGAGHHLAGVEDDVGDHGPCVAADLAPDGRGEAGERDAPGRQGHDLRGPRRRLGPPAAGTPAPASDRHSLASVAARESLASAHRLGR